MTPEREAQMREMFIQYRLSEGDEPFDLRLNKIGDFVDYEAWEQWQLWLACARALEPKWQPIETAPKDGTQILLSNGSTVAQGWWWHEDPYVREQRDMAGVYIDQQEHDGFDGWMDCEGGMQPDPTHWMLLPEQPNAAMSAALEEGNADV